MKGYYANRDTLDVSSKGEVNNLLTEADVAAQRQIIAGVQAEFPDDTIVGEEEGFNVIPEAANGRCWFIDPIDGTQNFVRGLFPMFGVSIGLADDEGFLCGGVCYPGTGDLFMAERGKGATRNGKSISVAPTPAMNTARIDIDLGVQEDRRETLERFERIFIEGGQVRSHCAAVVPLCSIACGEADVYLHVGLNPWDYAAGVLLITEAGGRVTRLDGSPLSPFDGGRGVVATNGHVHDELLAILAES